MRRAVLSSPSIRHCFYVVAHDDATHFNVFLRADRFYVDTPNVDPQKLARWKDRAPSAERTGGTATLWPCCEAVTAAEAEDAVLEVWLDVKYPRHTKAEPVSDAQRN